VDDTTIYQYLLLVALKVVTNPEFQDKVNAANKDKEWEEKVKRAAERSSAALQELTEKIKSNTIGKETKEE
jgi:hypothetical protein